MSVVQSATDFVAERWVVMSTALAILFSLVVVPLVSEMARVWSIPIIGEEIGGVEKRRKAYFGEARRLYNEGYRKFKDGVFRITTSRESPIIVLSPSFLPELKKLPDTVVSFDAAIYESLETKYTQIGHPAPILPHTVKANLTPSLPRINAALAQEVQEAINLEMPEADDWTEIDIHHILLRVVAMASGRVFVGPEFCRVEKFLDATINFTVDAMAAREAVHYLKPWLRPVIGPGLSCVKKVEQRIQEADEFIKPIIEARQQAAKDPSYEKPDDMLQWLIDGQDKFADKNSRNVAKMQLDLSFAAIHTTTITGTNAFYDMVALPNLLPELREEIQEALAAEDGKFSSKALQSMKKMDSFLKETLRLSPLNMASFQRKVLKSFTLSNGQAIPAGVAIEIPAIAINSDPNVFPNPDQFDPLRFYKLRQAAKEEGSVEGAALNQFVSVSQNSLTFGYGRHACPGRFFATNEIKMILSHALLKYDFKLVDGCTKRYPNMEMGSTVVPDPSKRLLCRKLRS